MLKKIIGISLVASLSVAGLSSVAFAQTTSSSTSGSSSAGGSQIPNQSNPQGLGQSMSVDFQSAGSSCCGKYYDHKNANGNAENLAKHFSQKLAAMQLAIIEAMKLSTGQITGNTAQQTGAQHTLADQQDDRSTVKSIEQSRMDAIREAANGATSCRVITGSRGGGTQTGANKYARELAKDIDNYLGGEEGPSKDGQGAAMVARLQAHCKFASQADVDLGLCKSVGQKPNADINAAESVFYQENDAVSTYTPEREAAAQLFALNAITPSTVTPLEKTDITNDPSELHKAAYNNSYVARSSIATKVVSSYIGSRTAQKDKQLASWGKESLSKMKGYENVDFESTGISNHDWLKIMSKSFLLDEQSLGASDKNTTLALKDIKNMQAVQTYLAFENYEMLEKISFILAAQLSIMNDNTRTDLIRPGVKSN